MSIPEFSVKRPVTVTMLTGIIVVLGLYSLINLGLELLPDITYPTVTVMTSWEGAAPEDVERQLTQPMEEMLALISRVKKIRSFSREGMSVIMVEFEWGTNLDFAAQDIRNQISIFKKMLPSDIDEPTVFKFDVSMMPAGAFVFTGDIDFDKLHQIADDIIKPRLERLDGVAAVSIWGWSKNQIHILLDPVKLAQFGINPQQVQMVLMANNVNMPAGHLIKRNKEFLLRTYGELKSLDEIRNLVVGVTPDFKPIYLRDIAKVTYGKEEARGVAEMNHRKSLWIMVSKESGANTVTVMRRVNKEIAEIKKVLPKNTKLQKMFDMSELVVRVLNRTGSNGIVGAILAMLFIYLFLRSWRPTLAISLAIPLSVIATFIAIYAAGYTLNLMTLVGLSLGVGMLVDNAVVVIENIYRRIEEGEGRLVAAGKGATQVSMAITASTLTTIAVFFPVLFIPGVTGQLSRGLALTVTFSLLASLFVALTLVPALAAQIFKKERTGGMEATPWFKKLREKYGQALQWVLHHKTITLTIVGFLFVLSILLGFVIGGEFFPKMDTPFAQASFSLPPGTPMEQTKQVANQLLAAVESEPDVLLAGMVVGVVPGSEFDIAMGQTGTPTNVNEGEIFLRLKYKDQGRKLSNEQIMDKMRAAFPKLKDSRFVAVDVNSQMMGGGQLADIEVKIYGDDLKVLRKLAKLVADSVKNLDGVSNYNLSFKQGRPELRIVPNKEKCARLGLSAAEVANAIHTYTIGAFSGRFNTGTEQIDIITKLDTLDRKKLSQILTLPIITRNGSVVPLSQVADIEETVGPSEIEREDQKRKVSVFITVSEKSNLREVTQKVKALMKRLYNSSYWEEGYTYDIGGQAEQMKDLYKWMALAVLVAFLLVYMVMASQFESFVHPFVIMFTEPLMIIGVMWALFITGTTISLPSLMGVVILAGIVVNNGIVLVDFINQLRRNEGYPMEEAIIKAGKTRLRPVLITALTTIVGMFPMAISHSQGAEMRAPMAIAVIGGLTVATFLTLFIIPVIYSVFEKVSEKTLQVTRRALGLEDEDMPGDFVGQ